MSTQKAKWTVLTYIAAHNNLHDFGMRSWRQICAVGSTRSAMHGVLYDGPQGASRYVIGGAGKQLCKEDFTVFDSGDPARLVETATWLFDKYPAERYALVLWSHGTGWQPNELKQIARQVRGDADVSEKEADQRSASTAAPALFRSSLSQILVRPADQRAILFDDGSQHSLDTIELHRALEAINTATGVPLELLGMDACLMASVEVAYQVRQNARFMVASEELVPAESWPYDVIYGRLKTNPDFSGSDLAQLVTSEYAAYYQQHVPPPNGGDVTKTSLDLSKIETLSQVVKALGSAISAEIGAAAPALWTAQVTCRERELHQRLHSKFDLHLWDLQSLVTSLAARGGGNGLSAACEAVKQALQPGGAVLNQIHQGDWFDAIGGLSIYLPMPLEAPQVTEFYPQLQFARDTGWGDVLQLYRGSATKRRIQLH